MKKTLLTLSIFMMAMTSALAQNTPVCFNREASETPELLKTAPKKVLPIATDEVISEAPEGEVVDNAQREGYSYYYDNGSVNGGYNNGFVGEYVKGTDGCIYLKNPCASLALNTYIKLDKVEGDDSTYVAHTAQLVFVDNSGTSPYPYFATRLVYHAYSATSYGYIVETDATGNAVTDIYFTYKDGVLKQNCQETIDMNGQILPVEMLGLTNSTGGWIGFGDACITIRSQEYKPVAVPEGTEIKTMSFVTSLLSSKNGKNQKTGQMTKYACDGNDIYLCIPGTENTWIRGAYDSQSGKVIFKKQYIGVNEELSCHQWLVPTTYENVFELIDEEENYGYWYRDYNEADEYVCYYINGELVSDTTMSQALVLSLSPTEVQKHDVYCDFIMKDYTGKLTKPATPEIVYTDPFNGLWAEVRFNVPNVDVDDVYINPDELTYVMYFNSDTTPYVFTTDDHLDLEEDMTEVPYAYDDEDFEVLGGSFRNIYYYKDGMQFIGIQSIHHFDGSKCASEIGWYNHSTTDIRNMLTAPNGTLRKFMEQGGKVVIVKDGKKYNANGILTK